MKKTVTLPDGTVEILEGTAEEIAKHEKLIRERVRTDEQRQKPEVLKGAGIEGFLELLKRLESVPAGPPIWVAPTCSRCYGSPCQCHHLEWYPQYTTA